MASKVYSPANFVKHWATEKPLACFLKQPKGRVWQQTSWADAYDQIARLANYLTKFPAKTRIGIYSSNCKDWFIVDMAIMAAGHISVPIYPSANETTIRQILTHSETKLVFIGIIPQPADLSVFSEQEILSIHQPINELQDWSDVSKNCPPLESFFQPNDKDIATIVYTSGTTGMPKGVVISYRALSGGLDCVKSSIKITSEDSFFSYLPLAHILERIAIEITSIVYGCQVSFVENLATFPKNLSETKPSVFIGVPRIWVKLMQGIETKFGGSARFIRLTNLPFIGSYLKTKIIKKMGLANTRLCITGAAAISKDTLNWYDSLGLTLCEGYGLSETMGISNLNIPEARKVGTVGQVMNGCEMMLAENGEILLRSPCLMDGYYKEDELTAVAIQDGWFRTGDLGSVDEEGFLSIKGRVKEIFKTSKGKYISPVPIEQKLEKLFNTDLACVFGSQLSQPVAVIVTASFTNSTEQQVFLQESKKKLNLINESLEKHEKLDGLLITFSEWTTSNGMMTPTLKIRRQPIEDYFEQLLKGLSKEQPVIFVD